MSADPRRIRELQQVHARPVRRFAHHDSTEGEPECAVRLLADASASCRKVVKPSLDCADLTAMTYAMRVPRTTIADNVAQPLIYRGLAPAVRRERAHAALARVGLEARTLHKPNELCGWAGNGAVSRAARTLMSLST
jgi:hypothetical protein